MIHYITLRIFWGIQYFLYGLWEKIIDLNQIIMRLVIWIEIQNFCFVWYHFHFEIFFALDLFLFNCLYFNNSYCLKISFMFYSTLELIYYFLYFHLIELYHYWISWFFFDFLCLPLFINLICTNYYCFNSDFSNNLCFFILLTSYY